jgi:hypothetical protein
MLTTKKIIGTHSASYYRGGGSVSADRTFNGLLHETSLQEPYVKVVVILGFKSMDHCGAGADESSYVPGWGLAVIDPFRGCQTFQNSVYAHELGHTFGLGHTNDGTLMQSGTDCNGRTLSSCVLNSSQRSWLLQNRKSWFPSTNSASSSSYDPDAVAYADVSYADEPNLVYLYKYYNSGIIDNLYSTDGDDPSLSQGYGYYGCVASIFDRQASGTIPLYRYYNSASNGAFGGDSFYTVSRNDAGYANYGYGYAGVVGYVFSSQQPGTVPFKRYFASAPKTDHFYTTEAWTSGFLSYNYEGVEGYVYPPPTDHCGPTDPSPPSANLVPLYHYYNPGQVDNFYTSNFNELGYGAAGYDWYGCMAWIWDSPVPGSEPLYRYYNPYGGDHFYTVDRNDAGYAYYGYIYYEGIVGYVFPDGRIGGTTALNRYFAGGSSTDHYYTEDAWTSGFLGYYFERTEAYAYNYHNFACPH